MTAREFRRDFGCARAQSDDDDAFSAAIDGRIGIEIVGRVNLDSGELPWRRWVGPAASFVLARRHDACSVLLAPPVFEVDLPGALCGGASAGDATFGLDLFAETESIDIGVEIVEQFAVAEKLR